MKSRAIETVDPPRGEQDLHTILHTIKYFLLGRVLGRLNKGKVYGKTL